jgi:serine/threonine-protein kinase
MGSVWQAHDEVLALPVAVKIVPASREDELYARFHQETHIIRQFSHKNIVGVLDAGEIAGEGLLFMAMELLDGSPLSKHLRPGAPLTPAEVIPVLVEVCRGLEAAHQAGVIHRDIKPENIFLAIVPGEGVVPKILDFGLSTTGDFRTRTRITADGQVVGTPMYMSPEQAVARPRVTPATDVWSMGVILYEAVAGKLPFHGSTVTDLLDDIVRSEPPALPAAVDRHTSAVLTRCLQKDPGHRYPDAAALRADLERVLTALKRRPPVPPAPVLDPLALIRYPDRRYPLQTLRAFLLRLLDHPRTPAILIGGGLVLRLLALAILAATPLEGDARSYHETAIQLLSGVPYEPHWPPGVPALLMPGYLIFGAHTVVGRAVMVLVYLAFSAAVLKLGRRLGGPRVANLALAVFAVTPIFVWSSVNTLTQLPTAALALGAVYFADRCRKSEALVASAGFLGFCLAGLLLTRPSNIAVIAALPLYLAWKKARWQTLVIPLAVVAVLTGAWCFKAYSMTGRVVFINNANSQNIFYGNNQYTPYYRTWWYGSHKEPGEVPPEFDVLLHRLNDDPKTRDALFVKTAMDHIRARPDLFLLRTVNRVRVFVGFDTFTSAQVAKSDKTLGALVLMIDAGLYLLLTVLALLFPAVVLSRAKGWAGLMNSAGQSGDEAAAAAWGEDRKQMIYLLLVISFLYALPYYFAFSHPTFHVPVTALVGMIGAMAGVAFLETGFGPIWKGVSPRARLWTVVALLAYAAIQVEWAANVIARAG